MRPSFDYDKYFEINSDIRIEHNDLPDLKKIRWMVADIEVGKFDYMIVEDYVVIVSYNKYKAVRKATGYKSIKMCIADLLIKYKGVFSPNKGRSLYSDMVWEKLECEYDVVDIKFKEDLVKMIYSNSISLSLK